MTAIRFLLLVGLLLMQAVAEQALRPLFDFVGPEAANQWQAVNDGVMGGVSDGRFRITPDKTMEFFGTLSLENNGGFTSVRTKPADVDIKAGDAIVVRVKGDGREYVLNLYTKSRRMAFSYRAPLADFVPTSFGRQVQGMEPVAPDEITSIGFMLSDKKAGPFKMQVEWVKTVCP